MLRALQEAEQQPNPTPSRLQDLRKSKVWKAVTHAMNTDIHEVRNRISSLVRHYIALHILARPILQ
jgi:hypothetical protein